MNITNMPRVLSDYQDLENYVNPETLKQRLQNIFPNQDFSNTFSILAIHSKNKFWL